MEAIFALLFRMNSPPVLPHSHSFDDGNQQQKDVRLKEQRFQKCASTIDLGNLSLGWTLPSLIDRGRTEHPNDQALNQWRNHQWQSVSNQQLRQEAEEIALGLLSLGLQKGDRVPLVMHSDLDFCRVDLGCLVAGLVNVPIDLTQTIENILFILNHTQAKVMVVSTLDLLGQLLPYIWEASTLQYIVVVDAPEDWIPLRARLAREAHPSPAYASPHDVPTPWDCLQLPQLLGEAIRESHPTSGVPSCLPLVTLADVQNRGQQRWSAETVEELRGAIAPADLATIIYIASETQRPRGVMLTHENISANALTAFSSYPNLQWGPDEVALLFLPLTHIFARVFLYGHLSHGHTIYLSDPNHVVKQLRTVRPTLMITVPRLLEKVYERLLERGTHLKGKDRRVFAWTLRLAQRFDVEQRPPTLGALQWQLADRLVFSKWRAVFGDRLKALICGGAALRPELVNLFTAAGVPVLQGYGLTETSGVVCYTRGAANRAGAVGLPIAGVELALAEDHEILIRAPFVMQGYYQDPKATKAAIDPGGWLHTGDLGRIDSDGFLWITGVKKPLFKLSTGKYVSLQPLESAVIESPLVDAAIAVGANQKFCAMLIFPNLPALDAIAHTAGVDTTVANWWNDPVLLAHYQVAIDTANCHLPYWSTVRQFQLVDPTQHPEPSLDNGGRLPNGHLNRAWVLEHYAAQIEALYAGFPTSIPEPGERSVASSVSLVCPINAKSLLHH